MLNFCPNCGHKLIQDTIKDQKTSENVSNKVSEAKKDHILSENENILDSYGESDVAKPGIYNWKKELEKKRAIIAKNRYLKVIPQQDGELSKYGDMIIGEGVTQSV